MDKSRRLKRLLTLLTLLLIIGGMYYFDQMENKEKDALKAQVIAALPEGIREKSSTLIADIAPEEKNPLEASGVIQATDVEIASELGGRITALPVEKGTIVTARDMLVQLDTSLLDRQIAAAQAAVAVAEAALAQVKAGVRPGQIVIAQAQLEQAQAARIAAIQAISDTTALVENPQDILMQIAVLRTQIDSAEHGVSKALAIKDATQIGKDNFQDAQQKIKDAGGSGTHKVQIPGAPKGYTYQYTVPSLPLEAHLLPNTWWQAWVGVNAAAAQKEGLEASLNHLYTQYANPQELQARVDQAVAALAQTEAQIAVAQAQVDALQAGASVEQIEALEARVSQAQAALDSLINQRDLMTITAPMTGLVMDVAAHPGEIASPGAALLTIIDLNDIYLTVYLPETQIGKISPKEPVQVMVDSFPDQIFNGTVSHIADSAEFTPRNVATKEERVNLVFAIRVNLENPEGLLKPGMPADVDFSNGR